MKNNKLILLIFLCAVLLLTGCGYVGPEKAVKQELSLIQELDESTIRALISYEDIRLSGTASSAIDPDAAEAVKLFFKNFKYKIVSSSISKDKTEATVTVSVKNLDAKALAKDLCIAMIRDSVSQTGSGASESVSSFSLMKSCLEENTYQTTENKAVFHLSDLNGVWVIEESSELEDQLVGGLVSYLKDPYLLTPEEVLETTLAPTRSFDAQQWLTYLNLNDVFSTGSTVSEEIDLALAEKIAEYYDYEILDSTQDDENAYVNVRMSSLDLKDVMDYCRSALLEYAHTTESIRATDKELAEKTAQILLEGLRACSSTSETTLTVRMANNGYTWEALLDGLFTNALLGGVDTALETLTFS